LPIGALATEARDVVARTRLSGEFRLGDAVFGDDRRRIVLAGRERGRNHVALSSLPSGRGIVLRLHDLCASELRWESGDKIVSTGMLSGAMSLQLEESSGESEMTVSIAEPRVARRAIRQRTSTGLVLAHTTGDAWQRAARLSSIGRFRTRTMPLGHRDPGAPCLVNKLVEVKHAARKHLGSRFG
jgi:hypothetical protein